MIFTEMEVVIRTINDGGNEMIVMMTPEGRIEGLNFIVLKWS